MSKELETMKKIQAEKAKEINTGSAQQPMNKEGQQRAESKRMSIDYMTVDIDPLR